MTTTKIIILILWFICGLLFILSPLPVTKQEFGSCWLALICYILIDIIEGGRRK
jgi:cell shape-determining protein MreD